jgi:hypothetical protein
LGGQVLRLGQSATIPLDDYSLKVSVSAVTPVSGSVPFTLGETDWYCVHGDVVNLGPKTIVRPLTMGNLLSLSTAVDPRVMGELVPKPDAIPDCPTPDTLVPNLGTGEAFSFTSLYQVFNAASPNSTPPTAVSIAGDDQQPTRVTWLLSPSPISTPSAPGQINHLGQSATVHLLDNTIRLTVAATAQLPLTNGELNWFCVHGDIANLGPNALAALQIGSIVSLYAETGPPTLKSEAPESLPAIPECPAPGTPPLTIGPGQAFHFSVLYHVVADPRNAGVTWPTSVGYGGINGESPKLTWRLPTGVF